MFRDASLIGPKVLFVVFSPCGTRLASCSRDLRTARGVGRYGEDLVHQDMLSQNTKGFQMEWNHHFHDVP